MSTTDWESGGEDVERVSADEGEEDVPAGSGEEVGGWSEGAGGAEADFGAGAMDPVVGGSIGDLGGDGWTESGGETESGAEVGAGREDRPDAGGEGTDLGGGMPSGAGAGDIGSESAEASLGGGIRPEESEDQP